MATTPDTDLAELIANMGTANAHVVQACADLKIAISANKAMILKLTELIEGGTGDRGKEPAEKGMTSMKRPQVEITVNGKSVLGTLRERAAFLYAGKARVDGPLWNESVSLISGVLRRMAGENVKGR